MIYMNYFWVSIITWDGRGFFVMIINHVSLEKNIVIIKTKEKLLIMCPFMAFV